MAKAIRVRRSDRTPTLYWWSLPLPLRDFQRLYAPVLAGARALVHPVTALAQTQHLVVGTNGAVAFVDDVTGLLLARHEGLVRACCMAFFPPSRTTADLERFAVRMGSELELTGFTMALRAESDAPSRHEFCFRVPGKILEALQLLAAGRPLGENLGQVEMALLQGLALRPKQDRQLELVSLSGAAELVGLQDGWRRVQYLHSARGYTGVYEDLGFGQAIRGRVREAWRRFPIGVVMFAGLPFFIGAVWAKNAVSRKTPRKKREAGRTAAARLEH